ncbi:hypothetical protein [Mycolicibacterium bacteremicum]|uniref:Uncharacterized protein n=1 Tax=Mycolicibacterium bacteremicum TaxID=564198 RepID=A0A1W9YQH7_MYCBA|nr:hypothetical protein [Mycolicibacterium bacteremicum]MCV7432803.1 hypothetical protein [Mycolicibacterium bacteremicum]ORA02303.1 hypothetical protein BST17_24455 [Mycolicibacterium bacteremicum]
MGSDADLDGPAMSDEQTRAQVIDPAKRLVQSVGLRLSGARYYFDACTDQGVAPFRGNVGIGFTFPAGTDKQAYLDGIVTALKADGFADGPPPGQQPHGRALHKGEVMAIVSAHPDIADRGVVDIYGECRNAGEHSEGDREDIVTELTS